jgi:hypothetical protein
MARRPRVARKRRDRQARAAKAVAQGRLDRRGPVAERSVRCAAGAHLRSRGLPLASTCARAAPGHTTGRLTNAPTRGHPLTTPGRPPSSPSASPNLVLSPSPKRTAILCRSPLETLTSPNHTRSARAHVPPHPTPRASRLQAQVAQPREGQVQLLHVSEAAAHEEVVRELAAVQDEAAQARRERLQLRRRGRRLCEATWLGGQARAVREARRGARAWGGAPAPARTLRGSTLMHHDKSSSRRDVSDASGPPSSMRGRLRSDSTCAAEGGEAGEARAPLRREHSPEPTRTTRSTSS